LDATATGLTAKGIKAAKLKRLSFAVPPLAEQERIVTRLGELLDVCDDLEQSLTSSRTHQTRFLEGVLADILTRSGGDEFPAVLSA